MLHTLILKTGSTLPELRARRGDFEDWIAAGLGVARDGVRVVDAVTEALPDLDEVGAAIVTGSAAMVTARAPWSVALGEWLARVIALERPTLGICYGHQLIADALGGTVGKNPRGREIGTVAVELSEAGRDDPLLGILGDRPHFQATHLESVLSVPEGARVLAVNAKDPVQAFAVGERAWCVQFHPECDADAIRTYIEARRDAIASEGLDPDALQRAAHDTPEGSRLLRRFAKLAGI